MKKNTQFGWFIIALLLICVELNAQEEKGEEKNNYTSSTSFSLLFTSGNSHELTLGFDTEQALTIEKNMLQFKGQMIYGRSEGEKKSEFYNSHFKYLRELSPRFFLLGLTRYERNVLAGFNHRFSLTAGAGYSWIKSDKVEASSEGSLGWSHENNIGQESTVYSFISLLVSSSLKVVLSSTSTVSVQELLSLNLDEVADFRISSLISLTSEISQALALKFSYQLLYKNRSIPGFKNTDHYFLSSLVLNL